MNTKTDQEVGPCPWKRLFCNGIIGSSYTVVAGPPGVKDDVQYEEGLPDPFCCDFCFALTGEPLRMLSYHHFIMGFHDLPCFSLE